MDSQHQVIKNIEIQNQINEKTHTNKITLVQRDTHKYKNILPDMFLSSNYISQSNL